MSLLSVTVKKAQFVGAQAAVQWNSYVTLKLQHVKSTTVPVKGTTPSWEQDYLFEVNNLDAGLLIEVWNKGMIWDKAVGYHWLHLRDIQHSNVDGTRWLPLEAELVMRDGEVVGTKTATGHSILIDARFELPYATELEGDEAVELQRKLEMLNSMLDQEARVEQSRKQHQYYIQSGVSEDSDYTSDVNYPIGQHPNSSASQFLSAANQLSTPQRSLNSSRENSYEKEDDYHYRTNGQQQHSPYYPSQYSQTLHRKQLPTIPNQQQRLPSRNPNSNQGYWDDPRESETDPLYYNSRPHSDYKNYRRSYRRRNSWEYEYNQKRPEDVPARQYSEDYEDAQEYSQPAHNYAKRLKNNRRGTPSLERQYTLYDDSTRDYVQTDVQDANSRSSRSYPNDQYPAYDHQNAHKNSVYDEYGQPYSDYVHDETAYDDGYVDNQSGKPGVISTYDQYANDTSSYPYESWNHEQDSRDQYTTPVSKPSKELPQLPVPNHYHRQPQSQTQSPYASQSTVKEVSVSSSTVPPVIVPHHHDDGFASSVPTVPSVSAIEAVSSFGRYGNASADGSFYDETNYNNHAQVDHSLSVKGIDAMVPVTTVVGSNDQSEQYMDSYENQVGYEDWQNYGYYDELGNYIQYDQDSYYDETGNIIISSEAQIPKTQEKDQYEYFNQTPAVTTITTVPIPTKELDSYPKQYTETSYYNSTETDKQQYNNFDANYTASNNSYYDQDGYWYEGAEAFDQTETTKPIQPKVDLQYDKKSSNHLDSQSSVEYNYAYQSAENLSSFEPSTQRLEKSESISRRASFRRQASTRGDCPMADGVPPNQQYLGGNSQPIFTTSPSIVTSTTTITTTATTSTATISTATNSAAAAANKLTSEIKSALPQLSSLTKGKSDLFSSSFSKFGSFVSSAAAKTGVTVPGMTINKEPPKEQVKPTLSQLPTVAVTQHDPSLDQGLGYSLDETQCNPYDQWNGHYDEETGEYIPYMEGQEEHPYEQNVVEKLVDNQKEYPKGPVHMDSLESNVSEGAKDVEDLSEAEYWQKQKERIAKQSSLVAQESQDYYQYDPYTDNKPNLLHSMDSTEEKPIERDEYNRQNSLDRDEWLRELEKQSGSRIRPTLNKKDTMSISLDRTESIDQQTDYGDEYGTDQEPDQRPGIMGQESLESADGYELSPPPSQKPPSGELNEDGTRKTSVDLLAGKEKNSKSVSFEEEPPKVVPLVPERQTKGMTPREKWLWAMNRICSQLAAKVFGPKA